MSSVAGMPLIAGLCDVGVKLMSKETSMTETFVSGCRGASAGLWGGSV